MIRYNIVRNDNFYNIIFGIDKMVTFGIVDSTLISSSEVAVDRSVLQCQLRKVE